MNGEQKIDTMFTHRQMEVRSLLSRKSFQDKPVHLGEHVAGRTCTTLLCTTVPMVPAHSLGPSPLKRPTFPSTLMMCFAEIFNKHTDGWFEKKEAMNLT